jgi:hypothetical protein
MTLDMIATPDFPHGTVAGYRKGCKSEGACPTGYGQTCARADRRRASEFQYGKAFGNGREVAFLQAEEARSENPPVKSAKVQAAAHQQRKDAHLPDAPLETVESRTDDIRAALAERSAADIERARLERDMDRAERTYRGPAVAAITETKEERHDREAQERSDRRADLATPSGPPTPPDVDMIPHHRRGLEDDPTAPDIRIERRPGRPLNAHPFPRADATAKAKSEGQLRAHVRQREHALATASADAPYGLTLGGEPRKRAAPGTILTELGLRLTGDYPTTETPADRAPFPPVEPPAAVQEYADEQVATAREAADRIAAAIAADDTIPAPPTVPGATVDDMELAAREADRLTAVLADTNWREVARSLGRIADALEKLRGLA